jgi:pyridoxamine 5'-phosphate oxidase
MSESDGVGNGGDGGTAGSTASGDELLLARARKAPVLAGPLPDFDPRSAPDAPGPLFASWLSRALDDEVPEPHVMTLSTASADGAPSARVLMLRGIDSVGCRYDFASDAGSGRKGRDLAGNPRAALTWYWPAHGRQIRIAGTVAVLDEQATRADFLGRSERARTAGFTGRMSEPLAGPEEYERERRKAAELVAAEPDRVPERHTLYRLRATEAEFFQADPRRFHLRVRYLREGDGWTRTLLWP